MSFYVYKAKNTNGEVVEGIIDAVSLDAAANYLLAKDFVLIDIKAKSGQEAKDSFLHIFQKVKSKDLVIFFRQLSVMVRANLPIMEALRILMKQSNNQYLRMVIADVANEVDGGSKLSLAMGKFPDVFGSFYVNVIRSGETSGRLSEVMDYLADQQEKDYELESKIKGAMMYPAFIMTALVLVGFILMTFVVPQMTQMLTEAGVTLPLITRMLIGISSFFKHFWWLIIIVVGGSVGLGSYSVKKTIDGRRLFDRFKINIPIFGSMLRKIYIVRITRSFDTLLKGGVPIARALDVVKEVVGNLVYKEIIEQAIRDVDEGSPLSASFAKYKEMPMMVSQMMSVGEETGKLDEVLERLTEFYSREINNSVVNLSTLIEPLIMVILGAAVGVFVAAIILPMWQLSSAM